MALRVDLEPGSTIRVPTTDGDGSVRHVTITLERKTGTRSRIRIDSTTRDVEITRPAKSGILDADDGA